MTAENLLQLGIEILEIEFPVLLVDRRREACAICMVASIG